MRFPKEGKTSAAPNGSGPSLPGTPLALPAPGRGPSKLQGSALVSRLAIFSSLFSTTKQPQELHCDEKP